MRNKTSPLLQIKKNCGAGSNLFIFPLEDPIQSKYCLFSPFHVGFKKFNRIDVNLKGHQSKNKYEVPANSTEAIKRRQSGHPGSCGAQQVYAKVHSGHGASAPQIARIGRRVTETFGPREKLFIIESKRMAVQKCSSFTLLYLVIKGCRCPLRLLLFLYARPFSSEAQETEQSLWTSGTARPAPHKGVTIHYRPHNTAVSRWQSWRLGQQVVRTSSSTCGHHMRNGCPPKSAPRTKSLRDEQVCLLTQPGQHWLASFYTLNKS